MDKIFAPKSVAVIGASRDEDKIGHGVLKNLLDAGFEGAIYPVNPKAEEILGLECYKTVADVPGQIDLAVVIVPSKFVLGIVEDIGKKKIPAAIVISAGFKESGRKGATLESELLSRAKDLGIRIVGPNCLGIINTHHKLNASFAAGTPKEGNIAFFSQSGALCTAILDWSKKESIGFSKFVSLGNKADVNEVDLLKYLAEDDKTDVILGYLEGVNDGAKFMEIASSVARKKPLIIAKSGSTAAGARAASSHTGTLAGSEEAFRAAFAQCGIMRAESVQDLFDFASIFASGRRTRGGSVAVVTNAGGPGILAADAIEKSTLTMADLSKETIEALRKGLPETAALYNPVDIIGDADETRYNHALRTVVADSNVDMVLIILTPQITSKPDEAARVVIDVYSDSKKPFATSFMGGPAVANAITAMQDARIPNYEFPDRAVNALEAVHLFELNQDRKETKPKRFTIDDSSVRKVFDKAKTSGRLEISDAEAREVAAACGFATPAGDIAGSADEAVGIADDIGYPIAMKIASPDILHKSDIGAVKIGLSTPDEARNAFREILNNSRDRMPDAQIWGVSVQQMIEKGREIILGVSRDPQFGPLVMFGLGGVYVEVMKDVAFRIAPFSVEDADNMVREIRSYPLLRGVRGEKPVDMAALRDSILKLSQLVTDYPEIVEMDINPLILFPGKKGSMAIDVRITIKEEKL